MIDKNRVLKKGCETPMGLYRIYIDETGNHDMTHADDANQRFLALTGAFLESEYITLTLQPELLAIKRQFFQKDPDTPVIFHRKEMVNCRPPFDVLRDEKIKLEFNECLLDGIGRWQYYVVTVVLDKNLIAINMRSGAIIRIIIAWPLCLKGMCYSSTTGSIAVT